MISHVYTMEILGRQKYRVLEELAHGQAARDFRTSLSPWAGPIAGYGNAHPSFQVRVTAQIPSAGRLTAGCCDALRLQVTSAWRGDVYSPHLPLCEVRTETCGVESGTQELLPQRCGMLLPDIPGTPFCNA